MSTDDKMKNVLINKCLLSTESCTNNKKSYNTWFEFKRLAKGKKFIVAPQTAAEKNRNYKLNFCVRPKTFANKVNPL